MNRLGHAGILMVVAGVAAGPLWWQHQQALVLRMEIGALQNVDRDLVQWREENARLQQLQLSPAALESLRADHAAIARLREQIEKLKMETRTGAR